jgi:hypothetical protein
MLAEGNSVQPGGWGEEGLQIEWAKDDRHKRCRSLRHDAVRTGTDGGDAAVQQCLAMPLLLEPLQLHKRILDTGLLGRIVDSLS